MTEPFSNRFFERHRRLREFLGFDFAHNTGPFIKPELLWDLDFQYEKKIGNVDISRLLPYGSPWEVDHNVRDLIRDVGKDGGYILTTCNEIGKLLA